ncbi:MAG: hypothetical protein HDS53_06280 [Barnesiella sp.]|nr:hypothetical protein [Barnesiella sp.]
MKPTDKEIEAMIAENDRRMSLCDDQPYDPIAGNSRDPLRREIYLHPINATVALPIDMIEDPDFKRISSLDDYRRLRIRHDFEYWAASCVNIRHKLSGSIVPFHLNKPQRRVLAMLEEDRRAGRPLRMIMLKARQWGGSTLIQIYFAWIQIALRRNWNSLICAHVKDTSAAIRGMYEKMLDDYPEEFWTEEDKPCFSPWQRSLNTREIAGRGARVTVSSSCGQDSARGLDFSMVHMSEVAFWKSTDCRNPEDLVRTICGGVPMEPLSAIVMESTANGVGNYFHSQWLRSEQGTTAYRPVFVAWFDIDIYRKECADPRKLIESLTPYERELWEKGLTFDRLQWYHDKRSEFPSDEAMFAEYPSTPEEAFKNSGHNVFGSREIEYLRTDCCEPMQLNVDNCPAYCSEILDAPAGDGELKVWQLPPADAGEGVRNRFVATVDIGGRWRHADYSVIAVIDRTPSGESDQRPEVVAQWRGHCDHDLLGRYAEKLARAYGNALLVVESNSLESAGDGHSQFVLEDLNRRYNNLYVRRARDRPGSAPAEPRVGFHTNRTTKGAAITGMVAAVRRHAYVERDHEACNEMATYELKESGNYGARQGCHDDILMTRAIALYVIDSLPPAASPDPSLSELIGSYF